MDTVHSIAVQPLRYREPRRDQRLLLPRFRVAVDGFVLQTLNWSLGGMLLDGAGPAGLVADMPVSGLIAGESRRGPASVPFGARVARLIVAPRGVALCFAKVDARVVDFLEDCLLHRLAQAGGR